MDSYTAQEYHNLHVMLYTQAIKCCLADVPTSVWTQEAVVWLKNAVQPSISCSMTVTHMHACYFRSAGKFVELIFGFPLPPDLQGGLEQGGSHVALQHARPALPLLQPEPPDGAGWSLETTQSGPRPLQPAADLRPSPRPHRLDGPAVSEHRCWQPRGPAHIPTTGPKWSRGHAYEERPRSGAPRWGGETPASPSHGAPEGKVSFCKSSPFPLVRA